ncbi:MAG: hypothetical protein D4R74_07275 [Betaproteobacteria bacterium]|nr:MAG: hypothetical protein D4R74_07275 [Betaproteobacteria bacterium]
MTAYVEIEREEPHVALAEAEATRKLLEDALAKAEAALVNTLADTYKLDANRVEAAAKLDKARARCRQLHAALAESNLHESITRSRERMANPIKQSDALEEREAAANALSLPPGEPSVGSKNARPEPRRRKSIHRPRIEFPELEPLPQVPRTRPYLLRQTIGFLSLVLAYLAYFHIDVQLQILNLPSVFP